MGCAVYRIITSPQPERREMSYRLVMSAYCGMRVPHIEDGELDCCRAMAARLIRSHRNRLQYPVTTLERGHSWELESDPEGASMIGDSEGVLSISENEEADLSDFDSDWDQEEEDD
jgi:hypothetical protein